MRLVKRTPIANAPIEAPTIVPVETGRCDPELLTVAAAAPSDVADDIAREMLEALEALVPVMFGIVASELNEGL